MVRLAAGLPKGVALSSADVRFVTEFIDSLFPVSPAGVPRPPRGSQPRIGRGALLHPRARQTHGHPKARDTYGTAVRGSGVMNFVHVRDQCEEVAPWKRMSSAGCSSVSVIGNALRLRRGEL